MPLDPLLLDESLPGVFSLLLRDLDSFSSVFEKAGHSGNGYSWQAVAQHVLESSLPYLQDQIEFDSEAEMLCATGRDRDALVRLGEVLADAARNPKQLKKLIAAVPAGLWDD